MAGPPRHGGYRGGETLRVSCCGFPQIGLGELLPRRASLLPEGAGWLLLAHTAVRQAPEVTDEHDEANDEDPKPSPEGRAPGPPHRRYHATARTGTRQPEAWIPESTHPPLQFQDTLRLRRVLLELSLLPDNACLGAKPRDDSVRRIP